MEVLKFVIFVCAVQAGFVSVRAVTKSRCGFSYSNNATDKSDLIYSCKCVAEICFRKCCPANESLRNINDLKPQCVAYNETNPLWTLPSPGDFADLQRVAENETNIQVLHGFPNQPFYFLFLDEPFNVSKSGLLFAENVTRSATSEFCVEYVQDEKQVLAALHHRSIEDESQSEESSDDWRFRLKRIIIRYGLLVSILFMLLTFFTYALLPSLLNLHGRSLLCHVASLIIGNASLYIIANDTSLSQECCEIAAFVVQFSFLASFFWLNIMCFDLWWTFSGYRSFNGSPKERDFKKFLVYCLYAWGCPTIIVAVTAFMQYYPGLSDRIIKPDFGTSKCWFGDDVATFVYFYSFISVILVSNLFMFISTTLTLKNHKKEAKVFKRTGSRRHLDHDKQRFNLYLKLFIVMGVNWMMEVISFYVPSLEHLWVVTDIGNSLQGILIFLIFVCKRRVLVLLNKKLCPSHMFIGNTRNRTCSQSTLTSSIASVKPGNICKSSMKVQMETMPNCATKRDFAI